MNDKTTSRRHHALSRRKREQLNQTRLEDVEVNGLDVSLSGNGALPVRIPNDNIGVRADGYDPLSGIQIEDSGGVRAGDGDETRGIHDAGMHALLPENGHPVLDAVHAVRNLRKVVLTQSLLIGAEGAIVAADKLESISEKQSC